MTQTAASAAAAASCHAHNALPDRGCTPGVADPAVTQSNLQSTICHVGYTKTVRPPTSYTTPLKLKQMAAYGYGDRSPSDFEEDHLISLELGGSPRDPRNLWPELHYPHPGSFDKDGIENSLHAMICSGSMTLRAAQRREARNWQTALAG